MNLSKIIAVILLRSNSVDDVLRVFDKTQRKLVDLSARLREAAAKEETAAVKALEEARRKSVEAERAVSVASKIADLVK